MEPSNQPVAARSKVSEERPKTPLDAPRPQPSEEPTRNLATTPPANVPPPRLLTGDDHSEKVVPSPSQLSHIDEYKMLREEIMQHMKGLTQAQTWAVVAGGAVYGWLMTHREMLVGPWRFGWFIPPFIGVACSIISLETDYRIAHIAAYLRRIEESEFGQDSNLPGWERYKRHHRSSDKFGNLLGVALWTIAIIGSFALSWFCMGLPPHAASLK